MLDAFRRAIKYSTSYEPSWQNEMSGFGVQRQQPIHFPFCPFAHRVGGN